MASPLPLPSSSSAPLPAPTPPPPPPSQQGSTTARVSPSAAEELTGRNGMRRGSLSSQPSRDSQLGGTGMAGGGGGASFGGRTPAREGASASSSSSLGSLAAAAGGVGGAPRDLPSPIPPSTSGGSARASLQGAPGILPPSAFLHARAGGSRTSLQLAAPVPPPPPATGERPEAPSSPSPLPNFSSAPLTSPTSPTSPARRPAHGPLITRVSSAMSPPPAPLGQESAPRPSSASSASALALAMGPEDVAADLARGGALAYDAGVQRRRESVDQGDDSDRESLASFSVSRPSSRPPSRPGSANGAYGAYGSYGIASARRERSSSQAETFASTSASASGFAPSPSPLPSLLLPHHPSQEPLFVRPSSAPPPPPSAAPAPTYAHGTERETPFSSLAGPAPRSSPALASPPLIHSAPNPHHTAIPMPTPLPQPLLNPPLTPLTPRQRQYTLHRGSNRFPLSGLLLTSADNPLPFLLSLATALVLPGLWWAFNGPFLWKHLGGGGKASLFVFAYLVLIMWASMLKTALTDPGILPRDLDPNPARKFVPAAEIEEGAGGRGGGAGGAEGEWRAEGKYLRVGGGGGGREGGGVVVSKWCETCRIYRPPRTSHCRLCDNCVEGTDHHCAFLNNCIGRLNYLPFLSFLLSAVLCSIYSIVFSAWHIYRTTTLPHPPSNPSSSSIQWNWETIGALVVAILAFGLLVPVGGLAAYHARLVWSNRTTVEMLRPPALRASLSPTTGSIIDPNPWALSSRWANVVAVSCRPQIRGRTRERRGWAGREDARVSVDGDGAGKEGREDGEA